MMALVRIDVRRFIGCITVLLGLALGLFVSVLSAESWQTADVADLLRIGAGFLIILSAVVAMRNLKIAAFIALSLAFVFAAFAIPRLYSVFPTWELMAPTLFATAILTFPGLCWLLMSLARWPAPIQSALLSNRPRWSAVFGIGLSFMLLSAAVMAHPFLPMTLMEDLMHISLDCGHVSLLDEWGQPRGIDFTARIVFVGPRTHYGYSLWAIARTERRLTKSSSRLPDLVVLRGYFHFDDKDQTYFVEGLRDNALFGHIFPSIVPFACGHTARVQEAGVALRVLQDGAPTSGGRIIGEIYDDYKATRKPVAGITITASGPAGNAVSITDAQGIFDFPHLPAGHYVMRRSDVEDPPWHWDVDLQDGTVVDFRMP